MLTLEEICRQRVLLSHFGGAGIQSNAIALYRSLGFETVGQRKHYYTLHRGCLAAHQILCREETCENLAIETSCDETAAALVEDGRTILSSVIYSQIEEHRLYGGVVPEIASRRHAEQIVPVTRKALEQGGVSLDQIDAVAVTAAPGLIGALLVGVNFAKGLALTTGKPLIPVHHIRGHIAACYLAHPELAPPFLCLVVSGGHSHIVEVLDYTRFRVIGRTWDDAAGEA